MTQLDIAARALGSTLRDRIRARELQVGVIIKMPDLVLLELAGYLGVDFIVIDTEHGSGDHDQLSHHLRAADAADVPVLVRVPGCTARTIGGALDVGATGLIIPHVRSAADAVAAVRLAHYPPTGVRGFATTTRAGRHGTVLVRDHIARADAHTIVIAQIEDKDAIAKASSIASTEFIDAVWIGSNDLSMSMLMPRDHPDVRAAEASIAADVLAAPKTALAVMLASPAEADAASNGGASILMLTGVSVTERGLSRELAETRNQAGASPVDGSSDG